MIGPIQSGVSEGAAIEAVRAWVDAAAAAVHAARGANGYPDANAVLAAFVQLRPTDRQLAMLKAHRRAPGLLLTATALATAADYSSYATANAQYGGLGRAMAEELEWVSERRERDGQPIWTYALGLDGGHTEAGEFRWRLRDEVAAAAEIVLGPAT